MTQDNPRIDLEQIATEQRNPDSVNIDSLSTIEMVSLINEQDRHVAHAVARVLPAVAKAIDEIVHAIQNGGRLIYIGAGTSGRLGVLDASECPPTFNTDPGLVVGLLAGGDRALRHPIEHVEDDPNAGATALKDVGTSADDVVVGIAASGRTPFVLGAISYARSLGCTTIGLGNSPDSLLASAVHIAITPLVGPEVISGSTRMKAGTSQKLVLNMLTTGAMVKLGKTFGNLMVDVQPTNAKLRQRAIRIVEQATGLDREAAAVALEDSSGEVKTAIVSQLLGIAPDSARERLAETHGIVRKAIRGEES